MLKQEVKNQPMLKVKRLEYQKEPESKSGDPKPMRTRLKLKDKKMKKSYIIFDSF